MRYTFFFSMMLFLLLAWASTAQARDVYVDNMLGDDQANGRTAEIGALGGPVRTITRALELVTKGGRIVLAANEKPYCEQVCIGDQSQRGTEHHWLTIEGGGATLDGSVLPAQGAWRHQRGDVFAVRPRRLAYQRLFHAGQPLEQVRQIDWVGAEELQPLQWALYNGQIYFRVEEGRLPDDYDLRYCGLQTGITIYNTHHVRIENLIVQGFQQDGINVHDTVRDCLIQQVECRANGRSGISVGGASRVRVEEASCYDNSRAQLRVEGFARVELQDCDLDEQATSPLDIQGGQVTVDGAVYVQ